MKIYFVSDALHQEMKATVTNALLEYKTTLKHQRERISELEGELEELQMLNQTLEERAAELELKFTRATSSKENLSSKVVELSDQLEGQNLLLAPFGVLSLYLHKSHLHSSCRFPQGRYSERN